MAQYVSGLAAPVAAVLLALMSGGAAAQNIRTDGTLGGAARTLTGPNYAIDAILGKQVGSNLFHSFASFNLSQTPAPETATFTNNTSPNSVSNVIARVTGGASSIDGAIKTDTATLNGASLYLINPGGIVFGPHATINVSGSFHAATADYLKLSDGARFQATAPGGSKLTAAAPVAFGFVNASPPALTVNGSRLEGPTGQNLSIVGGPVTIANGAYLHAPSGTVHIASAAGPGEIAVEPLSAPAAMAPAAFGPVSISGGITELDASDLGGRTSGGNILIRAGSLAIDGALLDGTNYGSGAGGRISLQADSQIALSNGARVHSFAPSAGHGADILLSTLPDGSIAVSGGVLVDAGSGSVRIGRARSVPTGGAGSLTVTTGGLLLTGGAILGSEVNGAGPSGPIAINAASLLLDGHAEGGRPAAVTGIRSQTLGGSADAADIAATAGNISILANGEIVSNTRSAGNAGRLSVTASDSLTIDATGAQFSTGIGSVVSPGATGNSGDMTINAGSLSLTGSSNSLAPSTFAVGSSPFAGLSAQTFGTSLGNAGRLDVGANALQMNGGAVIASSTGGVGNGGAVDIAAQGQIALSDPGTAITAAALPGATGNAGTVAVAAGSLLVQGGAMISSSTAGPGTGGDIALNIAGDVTLLGAGPQITALSTGTGDAGSISLVAANLRLLGGAAISTEAATANGGNIAIQVDHLMELVDSRVTTSVHGAFGNGGNILIDPQFLILQRSDIIAQAVLGHGGNITIIADDFFPSADSVISASSELGISGTVDIVGPRVDLNGTLVVLASELRNAREVLRTSCAARSALPRSSLTEGGRGGLPDDPETSIPAFYLAGRDVATSAGRTAALKPAATAAGLTLSDSPLRLSMHCGG